MDAPKICTAKPCILDALVIQLPSSSRRKCFDECCGIYEQVYQNDPARVGEEKERLQKVEDSLVEKLSRKKKLLTG